MGGSPARSAHAKRLLVTLIAVLAVIVGAPSANGAVVVVSTTADAVDVNAGNGACATSSGQCSLRAALQETNALPGPDTITMPAGTYPLGIGPLNDNGPESGDLEITDPVTIRGAGAASTIVDGGDPIFTLFTLNQRGLDRLFEVHPSAGDVTISGVTIREGYSSESGGAILNGSPGTLRLEGVTVRDSYSAKYGGGLNNAGRGRVDILDSTFTGNGASEGGAAINNQTTGVISLLDGSAVTGNPGTYEPDAGAVNNQAEGDAIGTIRVLDSSVSSNAALGGGAGIHNTRDGEIVIRRSTLTGNSSQAAGGAIFTTSGRVSIQASTLAQNVAGSGAALDAAGELTKTGLRPEVVISDSTIRDNTAAAGGGGIEMGGDGVLSLSGVTVTGNTAQGAGGGVHVGGRASLTLQGGSFTDNSGLSGGGIDAAGERPTTIDGTVFTGNDADADGGGGMHTGGTGVLTVTGARFEDNNAVGDGGGIGIHSSGDVELIGTTVRGNSSQANGGGIEQSGARVTFTRTTIAGNTAGADGGGVHNSSSGEFTIVESTLQGNTAANGGGLANASDSTLVVRRSLFAGNAARIGPLSVDAGHGGGILSISDGGATIENATISGNFAGASGGGLYHDADGPILVANTTIWRNSAPSGGGISTVESDYVPTIPPTPPTQLTLRNTIVAGSLNGGSCDAPVFSEGGNHESGTGCFLTGNRDRSNSRVTVDALAPNGGPTLTHALRAASPGVDGGVTPCPSTDQRGVTRPKNVACDTGAFEFDGVPAPPDDVPPDTTFVNPPTVAVEGTGFVFTGTDNATAADDLSFQCRISTTDPTEIPEPVDPTQPLPPELDFLPCTSPYLIIDAEPGFNAIEVRAIDQAGNVDPTPARHVYTGGTDVTPPQTTLGERPANPTEQHAATFTFSGTDNATPPELVEFECRIDTRDPDLWAECVNPALFTDLATGGHTVEIRAIDQEGNVDPTPIRYSWTVAAPTTCDRANITLRATADAWVDEAVFENFWSATGLEVRSSDLLGTAARTLVRFPLPVDAPECTLASATLRLHAESATAGRMLEAIRLAAPWAETGITWENQPGTVGTAAATASADGYVEWNVTPQLLEMLATSANHGFQIRDAVEHDIEGGGGDQSFASREMPQSTEPGDPGTLPELVIRYNADGGPPPPPPAPATVPTEVVCGQVITESTLVDNDLTDCPGEGLVVGAANVVLDLNGHTIDGPDYLLNNLSGQEAGFPAGIRNSGHDNVVVRNGTVQQFGTGVQLTPGTTRMVVEELTVLRNSVAGVELIDADDGRTGNTIRNNTIDDNELGIHVRNSSENSLIQGNTLNGNLGEAINVAQSSGHRILSNRVSGITVDPNLGSDMGIHLDGARDNTLTGNRVTDTGDAAIMLTAGSHDNRIADNVMSRVGDAGVSVNASDRNEIDGNVAHQASDSGVSLNDADDSVVTDNDVRWNPGGVDVSGNRNVIERNDGSGAGQSAIAVGSGSIGNKIRFNIANETGATGIAIEAAAATPAEGTLVEGNTANQNLADGIAVASGSHVVKDNDAHNNAGVGISADGVIDGGGNAASGNGGPVQCTGVVCNTSGGVPSIPADTEAPDTAINSRPPTLSFSTSATFHFAGTDNVSPETALRYECRLDPLPDPPAEPPEPPEPGEPPSTPPDGLGWETCMSPVHYTGLAAGDHRFEVRSLDQSNLRDLTPAADTWSVEPRPEGEDSTPDADPPDTRITQAPAASTSSTSATFAFAGSDNSTPGLDLRFECALDGAAFTTCATPVTFSGLALGGHTLEVRAIDRSGNTDPSPAVSGWTIIAPPADTTAPDTTITAGPDPTTVATSATLSFTSDDSSATFECSLDGATFAPCTSPEALTGLAPGAHTFQVRAVDGAGNVDATPASREWTIGDAPVPAAPACGETITQSIVLTADVLDCPADGLVVGADAITIDLGDRLVDGVGLGNGIRNDGFDSVTITNGTIEQFDVAVALGNGTSHGIVSAITAQQNQVAGIVLTGADEAGKGNEIRANGVFGNAAGIVVAGGTDHAVVRGNTVGANTGDGIRVEASADALVEANAVSSSSGAGVALVAAPRSAVIDNQLTANGNAGVAVGDPALGAHDVRVEGNTITESGGSGIELVDSDRSRILDNISNYSNGEGISLTGSDDALVRGNDLRYNTGGIELRASSGNRIEANNASSTDGVGIGLLDVSLGNTIVLNNANVNVGDGIYVGDQATLGAGNTIDRNAASDNGGTGIHIGNVGHRIMGNTADNNGAWGMYAAAGNVGQTNVDGGGNRAIGNVQPEQCFRIDCDGGPPFATDTVAPDTVITDGPAATTSFTSATFAFTGTDNATPVTFECRVDGEPFASCESPQSYTGLSRTSHTFEVRAVDWALNADPTPASRTWTVEAPAPGVPPDTTIVSGPDPVTVDTTARFVLAANEEDVTFECSLDASPFAPCATPAQFTGLAVGQHELRVRAVDPEGNADPSPAVHTWRVGPAPVATQVACGQILRQSVRLTNDLVDCPDDGLVAAADGITIDLDGHTIDGVGSGTGIHIPGFDDVTITGGTVQEFADGLLLGPGAAGAIVTANTIRANAENGIALSDADQAGRGNTIHTNVVSENGGAGIGLFAGTQHAIVRGNTLGANTGDAIRIDGASNNRIEANRVDTNNGVGVVLAGASANTVIANTLIGDGIVVGETARPANANRIEANTITAGTGAGVAVIDSRDTVLTGNAIRGSNGAGISLQNSHESTILNNDVSGNGEGIALELSSDNRIEANTVSGSASTGIALGAAALRDLLIDNTVTGNGGVGIAVDDVAPAGEGNTIQGNRASDNGDDGILIAGSGHTATTNAANANGGWGINAVAGTIDGGGNVAAANVEAAQCLGVVCGPGDYVPSGLPTTTLVERPPDPSNSRSATFSYTGTDDTTPTELLGFQCRLDSTTELDFVDCENPIVYPVVSPGEHRFEVRAVDADGRVDATPAVHAWTYEPLPAGEAPDTRIDFAPDATTPELAALFTFSSNEPDVSFECQLDAGPWEPCAFGIEYAFEETQVGSHTFRVRATDFDGNTDPTPAEYTWTIQGVVTTFLSGPAFEPGVPPDPPSGGETESRNAEIEFVANIGDATFECSFDLQPFEPCSSPFTAANLLVGEHQLRVVATGPDGQTELEPATYEWTIVASIDTVPPTTTLVETPADGTPSVAFRFTGTDNVTVPGALTFECRLDSPNELDFASCESPYNLLEHFAYDPDLPPGTHTLDVRAVDQEGNVDPTPASHTWTLVADTVAPVTTIVGAPANNALEDAEMTFEFAATDNATPALLVTFECAIDGAPFAACSSPFAASGLNAGEHTFAVRGTDLAGNVETPGATYTWTVEAMPETTIDTAPANGAEETVATFTFSSNESPVTFTCSLDGAPFTACSSPHELTGLQVDPHTFEVRATDAAGLTDPTPAVHEWNVVGPADTVPPDTTITAGPTGDVRSGTATFTVTGTDILTPTARLTFECSLDGAPFSSCPSPLTYTNLPEGARTLEVRAVDLAGNADPTPAARTWTVLDYTAPTTTILTGPEPELTPVPDATFTFTADDPAATFECSLDGGAYAPCTSPATYTDQAIGEHLFLVRATDVHGNVEASPPDYEWTVTEGNTPAGTNVTVEVATPEGAGLATVTFTAVSTSGTTTVTALDGPPLPEGFQLGAATYDVSTTAATSGGATVCLPYDPAAFADPSDVRLLHFEGGAWTDVTTSNDPSAGEVCGQTASLSPFAIAADADPPDTTIGSGPSGDAPGTTVAFTFSADEPAATFQCALDGASYNNCASPALFEGLALGTHELLVRATDAAGNTDPTPASRTWTTVPDTTPPDTQITTAPPAQTALPDADVLFTGTDDGTDPASLTFQCSLDGGAFAGCASPFQIDGLALGEHTFAVRAVDLSGNVDPTPATATWTVLGPPETTIDSAPASPSASTSATFSFSADQAGSTFQCSLDGAPPAPCTSPRTYTGLLEGDHDFEVVATSPLGGIDETPAEHAWIVDLGPDTVAPSTTLLAGPPAESASPTATLTFTGSDDRTPIDELAYECAVDGAEFASCTSPEVLADLTLGNHSVLVRAVDLAGNVDPTPASRSWTVVDLTAPDTSIDAGPQELTEDTSATFTFTSEDASATFECALDGADFAACTTPTTIHGVTVGAHTYSVRSRDASGNVDATPDVYTWEVTGTPDVTAPDTAIVGGPTDPTASPDAAFSITSTEAGSTFECSLDGAAFSDCEPLTELTGIAPGSHTLTARATDPFGNVDPRPASYEWTVLGPPETTIDSAPSNPSSATSATFTFSADQAGSTFTCALDGAEFTPCSSPYPVAGLVEGPHTFEVMARNALGAVELAPASIEWSVALPPDTSVVSGPEPTTLGTSATFIFTANDPDASFECSLDGAGFEACDPPLLIEGLAAGEHTMSIRAVDGFGNADPTPAVHGWTVQPPPDTEAPQTVIDSGPETSTLDTTATFEFSAVTIGPDGAPEPDATFECSLDGAAFTACTSPLELTGLGSTSHELRVRAADAAGNVDQSPATHAWTVLAPDTTAPETTIGAGSPAASTNATSATFTFTASEAGSTFECSLDAAAFTVCTSLVELTGLAPGAHTFRVQARDAAGNVDATPAAHAWTIDTATPETTISAAPAATTSATTASFTFTSSEAGATFECSLDGAVFAPCTSPAALTGLAIAAHEMRIRAIDAAGNVDGSPAVHTWTVTPACIAPAVTVGANADSWMLQSSATSNFGTDSIIKVDTKSGANARSIVRFANPTIPAGCQITNVRLRLYNASPKPGRTLQAIRVNAAWTEGNVRWNNQPATTGPAATTTTPANAAWMEWNVTDQVRAMYTGANSGLLIRDATENGAGFEQGFHSREKGTDRPPALVITFG